jgi:hypothetical protein
MIFFKDTNIWTLFPYCFKFANTSNLSILEME